MNDSSTYRFRNYYKCPNCLYEWEDEWDSTCDDDCPDCGERHIGPYASDDIQPTQKDQNP